jgi:poly(3-hydroxybutyrate) depolymerase
MLIVGGVLGRGFGRIAALLPLLWLPAPPSWAEPAPPLAAYNAAPEKSSISGISSGAFMAVQFATAWSSTIKGVGVIAGGPYYCAQGSALAALTGQNILTATGSCMTGSPSPEVAPLIQATTDWAKSRDIDPVKFLRGQKIYIFNGYNDAVVARPVTDALDRYYQHFLGAKNRGNLFYQTTIGAGHSQVTVDYGLPCASNEGDYIDRCGYDQAGIILQHIYGALQPKTAGALSGQLIAFDQRTFTLPTSPASYSLAETGYLYLPAACARQEPCRVHIALHGCKQYAGLIGDHYVVHAGYNEWADANHIIVLYPQTVAGDPLLDLGTPFNPNGCWDWWGYTDANYALKSGRQIATLKAMLDRLTSGAAPTTTTAVTTTAAASDAVPGGLAAIDSSDTAIALAWTPVPGAAAYNIYRATSASGPFALAGTIAGPSFADAGRAPATPYSYKLTAIVAGSEGAESAVLTATTRAVPPRCDEPGTCPLQD